MDTLITTHDASPAAFQQTQNSSLQQISKDVKSLVSNEDHQVTRIDVAIPLQNQSPQSLPPLIPPPSSTPPVEPSTPPPPPPPPLIPQDGEPAKEKQGGSPFISLWEWGSNVRLCTSSSSTSPFVQGVYLADGTVARVTVFEVEVLHLVQPGTLKWSMDTGPLINILAFFETYDSIQHTQWKDRALAVQSYLAGKARLRCSFISEKGAFLVSDASYVIPEFKRFINIHCPLPKAKHRIESHTYNNFKIQLSLQNPSDDQAFHLEPLSICRDDGFPNKALQNLTWSPTLNPIPPLNYPSVDAQGEPIADADVAVGNRARETRVALCVRPYHEHHFFDPKGVSHSNEKLIEFLNYHFLIGVTRVYFYERYGTEKKELLQPYIDRGLIVHIPFPLWSEVFYRKEQFSDALYPYNFPLIYDQVLSYEHCLMQGRRNEDTWMFFTDTDEFIQYPQREVGMLPRIMEKLTVQYMAEQHQKRPSSFWIHRFNYAGANESGDPVLLNCLHRCRGPIYNLVYKKNGKPYFVKYKDKVAAHPWQMLGSIVDVHEVYGPGRKFSKELPDYVLRINHYSSAPFSEYKGEKGTAFASPCNKVEYPWHLEYKWVEDKTLMWAGPRLAKCTQKSSCIKYLEGECGALCPASHT